MAKVAVGNLAELLANACQRLHHHCHKIAVGKDKNGNTEDNGGNNQGADNRCFTVDHNARRIQSLTGGGIKPLGAGTKVAA
ncbi:hypothetical protein D3C81_2098590 [compost metagenome]